MLMVPASKVLTPPAVVILNCVNVPPSVTPPAPMRTVLDAPLARAELADHALLPRRLIVTIPSLVSADAKDAVRMNPAVEDAELVP